MVTDTGEEPRGDGPTPVRVHNCSRIGMQATPPVRRLRFGGRRAI